MILELIRTRFDTDLSFFELTGNRVSQSRSWLDWKRSECKNEVSFLLVGVSFLHYIK